jgi:hypothetical protein
MAFQATQKINVRFKSSLIYKLYSEDRVVESGSERRRRLYLYYEFANLSFNHSLPPSQQVKEQD